jgi:hypothetical protein
MPLVGDAPRARMRCAKMFALGVGPQHVTRDRRRQRLRAGLGPERNDKWARRVPLVADSSTTAAVLGGLSIICGTVLAPVVNYQIAKDRYARESLVDVLDAACNQLTAVSRTWPQAHLAITSVEGETLIDARLYEKIYAALDAFAQVLWDARAIGVRLRIRLPADHAFLQAYVEALDSVAALERYVEAFRGQGGKHPDWEGLGIAADDAWLVFNDQRLPRVFRRATQLYDDA